MPKVKQSMFLCPQCGAATKVLRTRTTDGVELTRYRECKGDEKHRTTTRELVASTIFTPIRLALRGVMDGN